MFKSRARIEQEKQQAELASQAEQEKWNRAREAKVRDYQDCLDFLRGIFTSVKFPLLYYLTLQTLYNREAVRITPRLLHDEVGELMDDYIYCKYHRHNEGEKALKVSWRALGIALKTLGVIDNRVRHGGRTRWYSINKDRVAKLVYLLGDEGMEGIIPYYDEYKSRMNYSSPDRDKEAAIHRQVTLFHKGWKSGRSDYDSPFK